MKGFFKIVFLSLGLLAHPQAHSATIVALRGDVKILGEAKDPNSPRLKFEGKVYTFIKPRLGAKLRPHDIVQTGPDGQLKGVYPSGDQLLVGPGTAFVLPVPQKASAERGGSTIDLIYGKVRAVVSKQGPLANMKVKTPSAVAGVRGTDFYVASNFARGTTVTVLRGAVAVNAVNVPTPVLVQPGQSANVEAAPETPDQKAVPAEVKVVSASKEKLLELQVATDLKVREEDLKALPESEKKEVAGLETKATESVLRDIQATDPKLFDKVKDQKGVSLAELNSAVVSEIYQQAPAEKQKVKPTRQEIDSLGRDVYEKYFKSE